MEQWSLVIERLIEPVRDKKWFLPLMIVLYVAVIALIAIMSETR